VARRLVAGHRWLLGAVLGLVLLATLLPATTGSSRGARPIDLSSGSGSPTTTAPVASPGSPVVGLPPDLVERLGPDGPLGSLSPLVPTDPPQLAPPAPGTTGGDTPCASADVVEAVEGAQSAVEGASGQPLPVDVAGLFSDLAGCGSAESNPLDALSVVGQLLESLGIDQIPLPRLPTLPLPPAPPGLDALGPAVLPVCAEVIKELVTVAALAPVARIDTADLIGVFDPVIQVCTLFAPQG
jgi:hypothetical protein